MKSSTLLAFTAAALLATGSVFAGPNCKKNKDQSPSQDEGVYEVSAEGADKGNCKKGKCDGKKDSEGSEEGVYEVAEREGDAKAEKGERKDKGERGDRKQRGHNPLQGLGLTEDQQEAAKAIFTAARESSKALMEDIKAKKEAGEEVDRKAVHEQMMEIRKAAMTNVYDNVLTDDQRAKVDERRAEMEKRKAEREKNGKDGERPERPERDRKGKGDKKDRGGDDDLDL